MLINNRKQKFDVKTGNRITSACKTKTTTNKSKTTENNCGGKMGKSKQVEKWAPSCSAVHFGGQDKTWTGMAGAFKTKSQ